MLSGVLRTRRVLARLVAGSAATGEQRVAGGDRSHDRQQTDRDIG